jgi:hypothetical protein
MHADLLAHGKLRHACVTQRITVRPDKVILAAQRRAGAAWRVIILVFAEN